MNQRDTFNLYMIENAISLEIIREKLLEKESVRKEDITDCDYQEVYDSEE